MFRSRASSSLERAFGFRQLVLKQQGDPKRVADLSVARALQRLRSVDTEARVRLPTFRSTRAAPSTLPPFCARGVQIGSTSSAAAVTKRRIAWLALTLAFEIAFGRYVVHASWSRIASDYNLSRGGLLPVGLLVLTAAPFIAARYRHVL